MTKDRYFAQLHIIMLSINDHHNFHITVFNAIMSENVDYAEATRHFHVERRVALTLCNFYYKTNTVHIIITTYLFSVIFVNIFATVVVLPVLNNAAM